MSIIIESRVYGFVQKTAIYQKQTVKFKTNSQMFRHFSVYKILIQAIKFNLNLLGYA